MITLDDISTIIYGGNFGLGRLSPENRRFVEEARTKRDRLFLWKDLPEELRRLEEGMRFYTAEGMQRMERKYPGAFDRNRKRLHDKTVERIGSIYPVVREGRFMHDFLVENFQGEFFPVSVNFYGPGYPDKIQVMNAEIAGNPNDGLIRKVGCRIYKDIREQSEEQIEGYAGDFAENVIEVVRKNFGGK